MEFAFTAEQEQFRQELRDFFQSTEIQEILREVKASKETDPRRIYKKLGERGLLAVNWPQTLGGQGLTIIEAAIVAEEMSRLGIPEALHVISIQIVGMLLFLAAGDEQKARFLPAMARGDEYACVLYTEPRSGSDLGSLETKAVRGEDGSYVLSGSKVYSMKTHLTDWGLCAARTSHQGSKYDGLTLFMVPMKDENVRVCQLDSLADESFFYVELNGVRVSEDAVIGEVGGAWSLINKALAVERTGLDYYVRAQRWYDMIWQKAVTDEQGPDDVTLIEMARLGTKLRGSRFLTYKVLGQIQKGSVDEAVAAMSKWYSSELAYEVVAKGMDLQGLSASLENGHGYNPLYGNLEAAYREAPGLTISAGSSEMLLETVAKMGLGYSSIIRRRVQ